MAVHTNIKSRTGEMVLLSPIRLHLPAICSFFLFSKECFDFLIDTFAIQLVLLDQFYCRT